MALLRPSLAQTIGIVTLATLLGGPALAADASAGKDHPLISRFAGARLEAYKQVEFDEAVVVAKPLQDEERPAAGSLLKLEGKVTHIGYVIGGGKSAAEVMRNYEQALAQGSFQTLFKCNGGDGCGEGLGGFVVNGGKMRPGGFPGSFDERDRYLLARRDGPQGMVHVVVYVMQDASNHVVNVYQQVVESRPMTTGQVQVLNAAALKQGLDSDGKVAIYGVYFDSAKAEVKPESKPSLDEMGKVLAGNKTLKVYIVGHTDNAGALAANLELSQRRAEAVVKALVAQNIDPARLAARGVASLAPVASNATDAGKAKNRRVELVVQ